MGAPHFAYLVDATRSTSGQGAGGISGEQRPMVVSTLQVNDDSAKPSYCSRGTRFGTHSCNEVLAHVPSTFYAPDFGKLTFISYFDGGARAFDIRDPYRPQDVAHYVAAVHALPFGPLARRGRLEVDVDAIAPVSLRVNLVLAVRHGEKIAEVSDRFGTSEDQQTARS